MNQRKIFQKKIEQRKALSKDTTKDRTFFKIAQKQGNDENERTCQLVSSRLKKSLEMLLLIFLGNIKWKKETKIFISQTLIFTIWFSKTLQTFVMRCAIWYETLKNGVRMVGQNAVLPG